MATLVFVVIAAVIWTY